MNEMAKGHKYFAVGAFEVSDDGNLLAFSTDTTGYRQYTLQFKDLKTGKLLPEKIERVTSTEWSADGKYLFYGQEDSVSKRTDKIYRHEVGTTAADTLLFDEKDVLFNVGIGRSRDKKMMFIGSYAATMSEAAIPATLHRRRKGSLREENHEYSAISTWVSVTSPQTRGGDFRSALRPLTDRRGQLKIVFRIVAGGPVDGISS